MNVRSEKHILQTVEGAVAELEWDTPNPLPPAASDAGVNGHPELQRWRQGLTVKVVRSDLADIAA